MNESNIAKRYVRALMDLAKAEGKIDAFGEELKKIHEACEQKEDLLPTLSRRWFDLESRVKAAAAVLDKIGVTETYIQNFIKLLVRKGRIELLPFIYDEYEVLAHQAQNRVVMKVVSAVDLPQEQYQELSDHFSAKVGKTMVVHREVDPAVIGGLRVHIGDHVFDYTLKNQLEGIESRMLAS